MKISSIIQARLNGAYVMDKVRRIGDMAQI